MSVIIPCYNELESLDLLYKKSLYITKNYDIEIIFVDNGSNDGTKEKFNSLRSSNKIRFFNIQENRGYGFGIKNFIEFCNGEYIGWTHADLQTDLFDVIKAYDIIKNNIKRNNKKIVLKGKRFGRPFKDKFFSDAMSLLSSILFFPLSTYEICAQPSIFHKSMKEEIKIAPNSYEFDVYIFLVALIKGYKPYRFPVLFPERIYGESHWNKNIVSKMIFIKSMFFSLVRIFLKKRLLAHKLF